MGCALLAALLLAAVTARAAGLLSATDFLLLFLPALALSGWIFARRLSELLGAFFFAEGRAVNLAVFRVALFVTLLLYLDRGQTLLYSRLPPELQVPPSGLRALGPLHFSEGLTRASVDLLAVACVAGAVGFFTRTSALLACVLALYALGVPQYSGQVNHYHHLVWFAALLAVSRSGDALSVDAAVAAYRRAGQAAPCPPPPSAAYALPLRFVWLLLAVIYFFPGFWKVYTSGAEWAFSSNLQAKMYAKWHELGGWRPAVRVDRYPTACQLGALGVVCFELGFGVLVLFPGARWAAAALGLLFHNATNLFMRIHFWSLQAMYVSFIDWHRAFRALGRWLFSDELRLTYDGRCPTHRAMVAVLSAFDALGRVRFGNTLGEQAGGSSGHLGVGPKAPPAVLKASVAGRELAGIHALRAAALRVPPLWPVLPLLYVWPTSALGRMLCRSVARGDVRPPGVPVAGGAGHRTAGVWAVGTTLVVVNGLLGLFHVRNAWPFTCYPTFSGISRPVETALEIVVVTPGGEELQLDQAPLRRALAPERWKRVVHFTLRAKDAEDQERRLRAIWRFVAENGLADSPPAASVRFYRLTESTVPEEAGVNPLSRELLYEFQPQGASVGRVGR